MNTTHSIHSTASLAGSSRRLIAFAIDSFFLWLLFLGLALVIFHGLPRHVLYNLLNSVPGGVSQPENLSIILSCIFWFKEGVVLFYFWLCDGVFVSSTIGKSLLGLRVTKPDRSCPTHSFLLLRALSKSAPFLLMSYFGLSALVSYPSESNPILLGEMVAKDGEWWAPLVPAALIIFSVGAYGMVFFNSQKQMLHDKIAETIVVNVERVRLSQYVKKTIYWIRNMGVR